MFAPAMTASAAGARIVDGCRVQQGAKPGESGQTLNYAGIAREAGLSQPTVKSDYQVLEDMFIGLRIPAFSGSNRKNLLSTPKFLFFDLGVRHGAACLTALPWFGL